MLSKMITRRQKSASEVEVAILRHGPEAAAAAGSFLEAYLEEGETLPDLELLQRLFGRALNDHHDRIVASDEARIAGLRQTKGPRARRDAAADALGVELLRLRTVFTGCFGDKAAEGLLAIDGRLDRDPVALSRLARRAVELLRSDASELPSPLVPITPDLGLWAEQLEAPLQELEAALSGVRWERKGAESALMAKQKAVTAYDHLFLRVARLQEALFRFANLDGLADRVRPSVRRPGLTHEEAGPERASPPPETRGEGAETESEGLVPRLFPET
jgi:hypothetical protein